MYTIGELHFKPGRGSAEIWGVLLVPHNPDLWVIFGKSSKCSGFLGMNSNIYHSIISFTSIFLVIVL